MSPSPSQNVGGAALEGRSIIAVGRRCGQLGSVQKVAAPQGIQVAWNITVLAFLLASLHSERPRLTVHM